MREPRIENLILIAESINDINDIFYQRIKKQKHTMFFRFWKNHFEWKDMLEYPEMIGNILDFGCGSGHPDICLAYAGKKVHGIDNSKTAITICNYIRSLQPQEIREKVTFECLNVDKNTNKREYDSVWSSHCFEHIEDPSEIFSGLRNLTKKHAKMLISVPYAEHYNHPTHVHWWYSEKELSDYVSQWAKVLHVRRKNTVLRALCEL